MHFQVKLRGWFLEKCAPGLIRMAGNAWLIVLVTGMVVER